MEGNFAANAKTRLPAGYAKVRLGEHSNGMSGCVQMQGAIRKRIRLVAAIVIMLDAIIRISRFLFEGARPIDRTVLFVDVLVLLAIVFESVRDYRRERRTDKRDNQRRQRVSATQRLMFDGQKLLESPPPPNATQSDTASWHEAVQSWIDQTRAILRGYSLQAEASFVHNQHAITAGAPHTSAPLVFMLLTQRLNNLRSIMEKPDVYF